MRGSSVGEVLKHEREERHLSIEEVSSATRIPRRALEPGLADGTKSSTSSPHLLTAVC